MIEIGDLVECTKLLPRVKGEENLKQKPKIGDKLIVSYTIYNGEKRYLGFEQYNSEDYNNWFLESCFELCGEIAPITD